MKVLIIGGTSALAIELRAVLKNSMQVLTAGRRNCDITLDLKNIPEYFAFPKDVDVVIHTAASFGGKSRDEIIDAEIVNVQGTLRLCQLSVEAGVKHFIFISSMSALLPSNSPYYSAYAQSKKQAEVVSSAFCKQNSLPLTILRPSQLYGISEAFKKNQPLIYNMMDQAHRGENITIYGSNDAQRNYIYIDDFLNAIKKVIEKKITGLYTCQYTKDVTLSEVAKAAIKAFDSKSKIDFLKEKDDIPDNVFPIDTTLYTVANCYPSLDIQKGMAMIAKSRLIK